MVVKAVKIPYGVGETELVILKKRAIALQWGKGDRLEQFIFFLISILENRKVAFLQQQSVM